MSEHTGTNKGQLGFYAGCCMTMDGDIISENEIHISFVQLVEPLPEDLEREFLSQLPIPQQQAVLCLQRWQDRQTSLLGRILLGRALRMMCCGSGQHTLHMLRQTPQGRPFIPGGLDFNLSHSGETVVLAVCTQGQVGVDIEQIRPIDYEHLRPLVMELTNAGRESKGDDDLRLFYECWTRKEAVAKGCGLGLALPFAQMDARQDIIHATGTYWYLRRLSIGGEQNSCHLAMNVFTSRLLLEQVTIESLSHS